MIKHIQIKDYKCLHDENLEIKPFTIVTGVNSAGKSSLIQSIRLEISIIMQKVSGSISISIMCIFPITEQMNSLWFFFLRKRMPACRST